MSVLGLITLMLMMMLMMLGTAVLFIPQKCLAVNSVRRRRIDKKFQGGRTNVGVWVRTRIGCAPSMIITVKSHGLTVSTGYLADAYRRAILPKNLQCPRTPSATVYSWLPPGFRACPRIVCLQPKARYYNVSCRRTNPDISMARLRCTTVSTAESACFPRIEALRMPRM
jgi:hypothetical protein